MSSIIDPVRGMRDVLPNELAHQLATAARLEQVLASYGYQPIELPIIEQRDLYGRKLGEELVGKVYEFSFSGRELALRPEWTASVLRAYVGRLQDQPLPLRLRYAGPVFRNERPQRATYRQFTQVGVELIGGPAPRADAECIALACAGLDAAGVTGYRVRVGHIGLVRALLRGLGLAERTQGLLAWSLERMREQGIGAVRERIQAAHGDLPFDAALLEGLDDGQAEALLLSSLQAIGVNLAFGTRSPEAIVGRLVRKLRRDDPQPRIERALALLERLCAIQGPPDSALAAATALLAEFELPAGELDQLRAILDAVAAHGVPGERMVLDFGLGRGLHYYTGAIFEIYDRDGMQLCGGGRYDDLVTALGGRQVIPAVGFAYGLERVVLASQPTADERWPVTEVLVVAADDHSYPYALEVAQALRDRGYVAAVDVRGRSVASNVRDGARRGLGAIAVVGLAEQTQSAVLWRDLATREERRVTIGELPRIRDPQ
ncbi:MAG TPA: ATP phosphoribosyltransferase regulatory subunit [Roseiflexaceae bacterium]|nr:ATP phosphoribosyltransferase regulatory subunit [Roseiflexaceae bacterium]